MKREKSSGITIYYYPDDITLLYSLYPLLRSKHRRLFRFTQDRDFILSSDSNQRVMVARFHKRSDYAEPEPFFRRLREKYRRVAYFDDFADPREVNAKVFPYVDVYFKKQILAEASAYLRPVYGKTLFAEYSHERFGAADDPEMTIPALNAEDVGKIELSWNLGIGSYPRDRIRRGLSRHMERFLGPGVLPLLYRDPRPVPPKALERPAVSARLGMKFDRETVKTHRRIYLDAMKAAPELFLTGKVPLSAYNAELREVSAVFSPFGYGEVCFRDFEAILFGRPLIKPSMDHLRTWPDVYRPEVSYEPVAWDGSDLVEKSRALIGDRARRRFLASEALALLLDGYAKVEAQVEKLIEAIG